ncbi:hypothetical protein [Streptomyces sp. MAI_2237]
MTVAPRLDRWAHGHRATPDDLAEGTFSLPYSVAAALPDGPTWARAGELPRTRFPHHHPEA